MATTPTLEELEGIYGKKYQGLTGLWNEKMKVLEYIKETYVGGRGFGDFANEIVVAGKMMKDAGYTEPFISFYEPNMSIKITAWRDETDEEQEKRLALPNKPELTYEQAKKIKEYWADGRGWAFLEELDKKGK